MFNYSSFSSAYNTEQKHLNYLTVWKTLEIAPVVKIYLQPFLCVSMDTPKNPHIYNPLV